MKFVRTAFSIAALTTATLATSAGAASDEQHDSHHPAATGAVQIAQAAPGNPAMGMGGSMPISMSMGGMMGSGNLSPTAGAGGLAAIMTTFMKSAANASGMTAADMAALIQKPANCDGHI